MRKYCQKCKRDTDWSTLTENTLGYQYQYHECTRCGDREVFNKVSITEEDEKLLR